MSLAREQRRQLTELFLEVGALAPTLCEGWQAQDLAAHLWIREHRPAALPGIGSERFSGLTERIQTDALHSHGFEALVDDLRTPALLVRPFDALVNGAEYLIHHLDVARANGREVQLSESDEQHVWRYASMFARKSARSFPGRVVLHPSTGGELSLGEGAPIVHVTGSPSELLYFFSGRTEHARVELTGSDEATRRLRDSVTGL